MPCTVLLLYTEYVGLFSLFNESDHMCGSLLSKLTFEKYTFSAMRLFLGMVFNEV
jgi:hypothetical protein